MTKLAYMMRDDWGQDGTAMVAQSSDVRDWLGSAPYFFAVTNAKRFDQIDRAADIEAAAYIAPDKSERVVFDISELTDLG